MEGLDFKAAYRKFRSRGAHILGVSRDSLTSHENFRKNTNSSLIWYLIRTKNFANCLT